MQKAAPKMSKQYLAIKDLEDGGQGPKSTWISNIYAKPNWALLSQYVNIGIALNFMSTPVSYYLVETLDASSAEVNTYSALTYLPWCLKIFFGILSDTKPINGFHRRPYFVGGWIVFVLSNVVLCASNEPSIASVLVWSFIMTMGVLLADTVADAMVVECSQSEAEGNKGRMRTQGYLVRSIGMTIGGLMGSLLYNSDSWGWGLSISQCFLLQALLPVLTLFPCLPFMLELPYKGEVVTAKAKLTECWNFVKTDAVWIPMMYMYFYNVCYISNPAWYNFLYEGVDFTDFEVGMLYTAGALLGAAGIWAYDNFFFTYKWPVLYIVTTALSAGFSFLQLCLCYGWTFGMPNIIFATGDISLQSAVQYVTFMPMCVMFLAMIPGGAEGTLYALITTWQNVAAEVAYDLGTLLECPISVSNDDLENGKWGNLIKLTWITSAIQVIPIFFVYLEYKGVKVLPDNQEETKAQLNLSNTSEFGTWMFHIMFYGSIFMSCFEAIYVIYDTDAC